MANWDEGLEEQFLPVDNFNYSKSVVTSGNGTPLKGGLLQTNDGVATSFTVDFEASGSAGVSVSQVTTIAGLPPTISATSVTDPAITYAMPYYKSTVTVNVDAYNNSADFGAEFTVTDISSGMSQVIIILYADPNNNSEISYYYPGTIYKAVKLGNTFWAPVNIGATYISAKGGFDYDHLGVVMQWGRNKYFETKEGSNMPTSPDDTQAGPVDYAAATSGAYKDKFITTSETPYDWCDTQTDNLWTLPLGPCPAGWRLPVKDELDELAAKITDVILFKKWRLEIPGDDGQTLYLPAVGHRNYGTGNSYGRGAQVRIWSSTEGIGDFNGPHYGSYAMSFTVSNRIPGVHVLTRSTAAAVRCVKATI